MKTTTQNGPHFPSYAAALDHYREYRAHCYTSRIHGGQCEDFAKLREWVDYKIAHGEITVASR